LSFPYAPASLPLIAINRSRIRLLSETSDMGLLPTHQNCKPNIPLFFINYPVLHILLEKQRTDQDTTLSCFHLFWFKMLKTLSNLLGLSNYDSCLQKGKVEQKGPWPEIFIHHWGGNRKGILKEIQSV
jgi:hypothetical protein